MEGFRSRDRVDKYGEIFTPEWTVKEMLDTIPSDFDMLNETCLEPSCGDGNFLVEILRRKLNLLFPITDKGILNCFATIYGIDIQADNVMDSRKRLLGVAQDFCDAASYTISEDLQKNIELILQWNICLGDFLEDKYIKMNNDGYVLLYESEELDPVNIKLIKDDGSRVDISYLFERATSSRKFGDMTFRVWNVEDMSFTVKPLKESREIESDTQENLIAGFKNLLGN